MPRLIQADTEIEQKMREQLIKLLEPAVEGLGYELAHLEWVGIGSGRTLRLFIDSEDGVDVDDCEKVSREVSAVLDVENAISGAYNLEVSSPGLDRHLVKPAHFQRFIGEETKFKLNVPREGRRSYRATIVAADEQEVTVNCDEGELSFEYAEIESARLVPRIEL